jgi:hypothetical protein
MLTTATFEARLAAEAIPSPRRSIPPATRYEASDQL